MIQPMTSARLALDREGIWLRYGDDIMINRLYGLLRGWCLCAVFMAMQFTVVASAQTEPGGLGCAVQGYLGAYMPTPEGETYGLLVDGNIAYVIHFDEIEDQSLLIALDYSDPEYPQPLDSVVVDSSYKMRKDGDRLYLYSDDDHQILILDVSHPNAIDQVAIIGLGDDSLEFHVRGERLYYLDSDRVIRVLDIADPANAIELGHIGTPELDLRDFDVCGDRVYASLGSEVLYAYDISDLNDPIVVATHPTDVTSAASVWTDGDLMLLHGPIARFELLRLDPGGDELTLLSNYASYDLAEGYGVNRRSGIDLQDGVLTISADNGSVLRASVEQPEKPRLIAHTGVPAPSIGGVGVTSNGATLVVGYEQGLIRFDLERAETVLPLSDDWSGFREIEWFHYFLDTDIRLENGVLYAPYYFDDYMKEVEGIALAAINIDDPAEPELISSYITDLDWIEHIEVKDGILFIGRDGEGLEIVDFRNPSVPERILHFTAFPEIQEMGIDGDTLWMRVDHEEHVLLDIADINNISFKAYYKHHADQTDGAMFANGLLYLSAIVEIDDEPFERLSVVDLGDPLRPIRVDHPAPDIFDEISIHDGVLYGINDSDDIIYTSPTDDLVDYGSVTSFGRGRNLQVIGDYAYWNSDFERMLVLDISDPYSPQIEGMLPSMTGWFNFGYQGGVMMLVTEYETYSVNLNNRCVSGCIADVNDDGELNFFDVAAMLQAYLVSDPSVDFNGDLGVDFHDVSLFLMVYSNGCM